MKKALVVISQGFEEIEFISIVDVLRRGGVKVNIAGLNKKQVIGSHEVEIKSSLVLEDIIEKDYDMIVLPGGLPNAEILANDENVKSLLKAFDAKEKYIGAICAAPLALAKAGVLKQKYTCYPSFENIIKQSGYNKDKNVVIDENIITSKGPATAMEFSLHLLKLLCGDEKYKEIKEQLLMA